LARVRISAFSMAVGVANHLAGSGAWKTPVMPG
jgi:hypothetical protein